MPTITQPGPTALQVSGKDAKEQPILAVLAKRSYRIVPDKACIPLDEGEPLVMEQTFDADNPNILVHDCELAHYKMFTDVVVKGHAYAYTPQATFQATVRLGKAAKTLAIFGPRKCSLNTMGQILFSPPAAVDKVPLKYTHAYGGRDAVAEKKHGIPGVELAPYFDQPLDFANMSPFLYPRNCVGKGYLVEPTREAVEQVELPNIEDPIDPLTPDRLAVQRPDRWPVMPLPQGTDWFGYDWFPRMAYAGMILPYEPFDGQIAEVARGFAPPDLLEIKPIQDKLDWRLTNGASLGLQLPYLTGKEAVELVNVHPKLPTLRFSLPGVGPKIWTDGRKGKMNPTEPVIHSVVIEPDKDQVHIVWCGSAPALRMYMDNELEKMPLKVEW
jgi:hypothetical protein